MSHGYQHILGIQRLACFGGVVFAVIIMVQYSATKIHINKTGSYAPEKSSPPSHILGDMTRGANSTGPSDVLVNGIRTTYTRKENRSETKKELDDFQYLNRNGVLVNNGNATTLTVPLANVSSLIKVPHKKQKGKVVSISEMHDILVHNRASSHSKKPLWSERADQELLTAKLQIENAPLYADDHDLYPSVYRNASLFRSYELMENTLKVYIYKEGEKPIFNKPEAVMKGIYASEGWFMMQMKKSKRFVTTKSEEAHLFYIPYSSKMLKATLSPYSYDRQSVVPYLKNYLDMISRTGGADHFLVSCHDWMKQVNSWVLALEPSATHADVQKAGFKLGKDVSLHETNVRDPHYDNLEVNPHPNARFLLSLQAKCTVPFVRFYYDTGKTKILIPDMKIFGKLPKVKDDRNYVDYMKSSKFCICAKGSEVNSPRVVEAIFYECVPVIISDNFVPPFFEILDWESFAVFMQEKDIPNLKTILLSIPNKRYLKMHQRVKQVQQHFLWHVKPVRYDIFHMILHSIWSNRVLRINLR